MGSQTHFQRVIKDDKNHLAHFKQKRDEEPPVKKRPFSALESLLDYIHEATEISGRWVNWQIIRCTRYVCWETDRTKISRWSQSIIETELCLREITQHETYMKECVQIVHADPDKDVKALLPEMIDELIALDHEYMRIERTYDALLAGCPPGPIKGGYLWIRRDPQWYMKTWVSDDGEDEEEAEAEF
ncbi:uncharacterized protein N7515_001525 [Penicillium bovifimosum]|uniref:Uncharacterized protein n=1 Tax=Penicillium bovifimosum TaxID=126998 RepID=A0A9W9HA47_9EURO|nr:uncharacterized protein N7515_001525 [Penicillium bovifimosum]KAJ5142738.1 hypothetical protein N7515_001525 [Penicillium bovifimosum]